jgi:hypothetical protein
MSPEPWLRGPLPDVDPFLMPAAHVAEHTQRHVGQLIATAKAVRS